MKNPFFVVCLCIGLCVALFTGVFAVMGWGDLLRQVGSTILYPFQWMATQVSEAASGFGQYVSDLNSLSQEVQALREENQSLKASLQEAELIREEYTWLYGYLSMKEEHSSYSLCAAVVTARTLSGAYAVELTLNKGSAHGIAVGMPVVTTEGLVGMVYEVSPLSCRVRTLLSTSASVAAVTARAGESGLCEGNYTALTEGQVTLRYLPAEADVAEGDSVLTSGEGSVYPYGIPVGRVAAVTANGYNRTTEATVEPFVDFTALNQVMILTDFDRYAEGYGQSQEADSQNQALAGGGG